MKVGRLMFAFLPVALLAEVHAARADAVLDWNEIALQRVVAARQPPPEAARAMAMVHVAMFDAVDAVDRRYKPYAHEARGPDGASPEAAAIAAAHGVLAKLFPDQLDALDKSYATSLAALPNGAATDAGVAIGRQVASECLAMRASDGSGGPALYREKIVPGVYVATAFPVSSQWPKVKPWFMHEPSQFRPNAPPALDSAQWTRDIEEIRAMGGRNSTARTAEQTDVARFWAITGPPSWNPIVRALAQSRNATLVDNARLFALVNMAGTDALIAVFDAKYAYEFWRPVTAIRYSFDPGWLPLVETPMHPEYPCAHCISSAAVGAVLESEFGTGTVAKVTMTSPTAPGVSRSWTRIGDYVQEVNNARIWGGIHYRNSTEVGESMGRSIAALAIRNFMMPAGSLAAKTR